MSETAHPEPGTDSNALAALGNNKLKIPGDVVNKATQELPDHQRSVIRKFHSYYMENDLSLGETAKLIRYDAAALSLVFRGKYTANLDTIVKEMNDFLTLAEKRASGQKLNFIETALTRRIWSVCSAALEFQRIAFIFGDTQIGKTEALKAYARAHNHGSTIYVSVPTQPTVYLFMGELARALRISSQQRVSDLRRRIMDSFDDRMLLIIDEAHRCTPENGRGTYTIQVIEFIRELFDERKCGVVISATNVFRKAMDDGPAAKLLKQTSRRRLCALKLPDRPTREDLNTFAAAHGLPPSDGDARKLETQMVDDEALGMWLTLLRMAAKMATTRKAKLTWAHVISAHAGLKELEGQKF